jgi:tetrahydromethanopterin S-methyltransferase subunit A
VDQAGCSGCGTCASICPEGVFEIREENERRISVIVDEEKCSACLACKVKWPEGVIDVKAPRILKVTPPPGYPPEEGRFIRGNDFSPVAVVAILDTFDTRIPPELVKLVQIAVESGAALAGTLQTENIGIEKIVANVVANPNIRYLILCWRESQGHLPADAVTKLVKNGVAGDKKRTIIGAVAPTPYLPNISLEAIERFRKQVKIVSLILEDNPTFGMLPENVRKAVWSCIQEKPTAFLDYQLYDPGAWEEPAICQKITMRITEPWRPEISKEGQDILERIKKAARERKQEHEEIT